jgi:putative endonuclease
MVECVDGSFYTGCTTNVEQRIIIHNQGKGAKYTRSHLPVKLVFTEPQINHPAALKREREIKKLSHQEKLMLKLDKTPK